MIALLEKVASGVLIHIKGRLDADSTNDFDRILADAVQADLPRILIDMADVDYISSAGLRVLLKYVKIIQSKDCFIELIHTRPDVRKVLLVVGFDELLPIGEGTMQIIDVLKQTNSFNSQAMRNARFFLNDLFASLQLEDTSARMLIDDIFRIFREEEDTAVIETKIKALIAPFQMTMKFTETLKERAENIYSQAKDYLPESGSLLDVGSGEGRIGEAFASAGRPVQLMDTSDYNLTRLPFKIYNGVQIPFPDKAFTYSLAVNLLHHAQEPMALLKEMLRVTEKRVVIIESVYINEAQRRFNMFFDWFYNRIISDDVALPCNFNSPEGWEYLFRRAGFSVTASVELGLNQILMPEYLWLYTIDVK